MAGNYFELCGRLDWIDYKSTDNGYLITTITLGVKKNKEEWNNFFIKFFDTADSKNTIAEKLQRKTKGDYIRVKGYITLDKFKPNGSDKEVSNISLIGTYFNGIHYDQFEKGYVDDV